jgi:hypothetical protein
MFLQYLFTLIYILFIYSYNNFAHLLVRQHIFIGFFIIFKIKNFTLLVLARLF